jgi:DNA-binding LytR/AlgR family response regulator
MEELLPECFIKINKSSLANQNRIERFTGMYTGAVDVVFKSGYTEYVSRRCFADIKRRLNVK